MPTNAADFDPSGERESNLDDPASVTASAVIDAQDRIRADEVMARADRTRRWSLIAAGALLAVLAAGQAVYFVRRWV